MSSVSSFFNNTLMQSIFSATIGNNVGNTSLFGAPTANIFDFNAPIVPNNSGIASLFGNSSAGLFNFGAPSLSNYGVGGQFLAGILGNNLLATGLQTNFAAPENVAQINDVNSLASMILGRQPDRTRSILSLLGILQAKVVTTPPQEQAETATEETPTPVESPVKRLLTKKERINGHFRQNSRHLQIQEARVNNTVKKENTPVKLPDIQALVQAMSSPIESRGVLGTGAFKGLTDISQFAAKGQNASQLTGLVGAGLNQLSALVGGAPTSLAANSITNVDTFGPLGFLVGGITRNTQALESVLPGLMGGSRANAGFGAQPAVGGFNIFTGAPAGNSGLLGGGWESTSWSAIFNPVCCRPESIKAEAIKSPRPSISDRTPSISFISPKTILAFS